MPRMPPGVKKAPNGQSTRGLRVHVCNELLDTNEQCGKLYSRAEHLRRHQLTHNKPVRSCPYHGCKRSFHRVDLLKRHVRAVHEAKRDHSPASEPDTLAPNTEVKQPEIEPLMLVPFDGRSAAERKVLSYCLKSVESLYLPPTVPSGSRIWWLKTIPHAITMDNSIMNVMLSFGSAKMQSISYEPSLDILSRTYFFKAIKTHREQVHDVQSSLRNHVKPRETIDTIILIGYFLAIRALINLQQYQGPKEQRIDNIVLYFQICYGMTRLCRTLWPYADTSVFYPTLMAAPSNDPFSGRDLKDLSELQYFPELLSGMEEETSNEDLRKAYLLVMYLLQDMCIHLYHHAPPGRTLQTWKSAVFSIPIEFVQAVQDRRPRALAIAAHFFCLAKFIGNNLVWWLPSDSKGVVNLLEALADAVPADWTWAMEWPLKVAMNNDDFSEAIDKHLETSSQPLDTWCAPTPRPWCEPPEGNSRWKGQPFGLQLWRAIVKGKVKSAIDCID